jgi:hypothetical protein
MAPFGGFEIPFWLLEKFEASFEFSFCSERGRESEIENPRVREIGPIATTSCNSRLTQIAGIAQASI